MSNNAGREWSGAATEEDIYYCYRLLLKRRPDDEGFDYWQQRIATEQFSFGKLAAYFSRSLECVTSKAARGLTLVELDDFDLYVYEHDWDVGENLIQNRQHEPHVTAFLKKHLREGMTFVDVGANVGYFTLMGAKLVGPTGTTIAIECNPENCELIHLSLHRNQCENAAVFPLAISDSRKPMTFRLGFSNVVVKELTDSASHEAIGYAPEAVIVQAVTLDSLLGGEPRIDLIKLDIEGSEAKAWRGMQNILSRQRPTIVTEFFPALLREYSQVQPEELLQSVLASGYRIRVVGPEENESALTVENVMTAWRKRCEIVGESKASLDLLFT